MEMGEFCVGKGQVWWWESAYFGMKQLRKVIKWSAVPLPCSAFIFEWDFLSFLEGKQCSGPNKGQSPVERGDFPSVHPSVGSPLWGIQSDLRPSQPGLRPSWPSLRPSQPGMRPSQPGLKPETWLASWRERDCFGFTMSRFERRKCETFENNVIKYEKIVKNVKNRRLL